MYANIVVNFTHRELINLFLEDKIIKIAWHGQRTVLYRLGINSIESRFEDSLQPDEWFQIQGSFTDLARNGEIYEIITN